jgi:hypothetical protein
LDRRTAVSDDGLPHGLHRLFPDGGAEHVLDVDLPPGRLVAPSEGAADQDPAYWLSDEPAGAGLWVQLRKSHARSGLWPVIASGLHSEPERPWAVGEVSGADASSIDGLDAGEIMADFWREWIEDGEQDDSGFGELEPFGRGWPGLAPTAADDENPDELAEQYVLASDDGTSPIMLVPAARSADVISAVGWQGPVNYTEDMARLSAVLRSWEDRFGARVIEVGFDTLVMAVAAPPVTAEHAERVAAEHFAFCPDNVVQGPGTIRAYAAKIMQKYFWVFWWD